MSMGPSPQHLQPGTIPFRAVQWLRAQADLYPDRWYSTPDICESLDCDSLGFTAYMKTARTHGLVRAETKPETGKLLWWRIGDGVPVDLHAPREKDQPLHQAAEGAAATAIHRASIFPAAEPKQELRAMECDGRLLVTGMEIRDGVAIFEPEQVLQLKRTTDWWRLA